MNSRLVERTGGVIVTTDSIRFTDAHRTEETKCPERDVEQAYGDVSSARQVQFYVLTPRRTP